MTRPQLRDLAERVLWVTLYGLVLYGAHALEVASDATLLTLAPILLPVLSTLKSAIGAQVGSAADVAFGSRAPSGVREDGLVLDGGPECLAEADSPPPPLQFDSPFGLG